MKEFFESIIATGTYDLSDLEDKITKMWIVGKLTEEEKDELIQSACDSVDNSAQVDLFQMVVDLEHRVYALETSDIPIWSSGYVTQKGEVVRYDVTGDGEYDLCMYDGGRSETALSIGRIAGWYLVDTSSTKLKTITKNADGTYTLGDIE